MSDEPRKKQHLIETLDDGVATLTMNRPEARNALSGEMMQSLSEAIPRLAADPEVRLVVLTGADEAFCAGGDVKSVLQNNNIKSLYGLVANAGIGGENTYGEKDRWREVIETNLTGTYQTIQECLPYLKKDDAPFKKVVILSSILARLGVPGYSAYCASKAGLLGLTRALAAEHSGNKILINALCPGWVNTDMAQEGIDGFCLLYTSPRPRD